MTNKKNPIILVFIFSLLSMACAITQKTNGSTISNETIVHKWIKKINKKPKLIKIQTANFMAPDGGHFQGIQQLDPKHLVISGSSNDKAYFFISKMVGINRVKRRGSIHKMIYINDDFPGMQHNHASGIQILDNLLAIGTEGGGDVHKSSIVFYNLDQPDHPKPLPTKINRQEDTAGAIGLVAIGDSLLLAVGGWDSDRIDFYWSKQGDIELSLNFSLWKTWQKDQKFSENWIDNIYGSYQALNFIKGDLKNVFLVGFYQDFNLQNWADIYQVNFNLTEAKLLKKVARKAMYPTEGISFKNGAGLTTLNLPKQLNFLATERNWQSFIRINYW